MRVFVTGATGTVGRHVVAELLAAGAEVRALTRRPQSAGLPAGVEVVGGDLAEPESLESTMDGADRMYLLGTEHIARVVDVAKRAGVERIVLLSSAMAEFDDDTERAVTSSGLEWTLLRPGMFTANLLDWAEGIRTDGVVREPYAAARQAPVHEVDIAAVAAAALLSGGHNGKTYTLSGPESLTKVEQVAAIGTAVGRELRFEELSPELWRQRLGAEYAEVAGWLLDIWAQAAAQPEPVLPTVPEVLGRPARTVAEWAADQAAFR